MRPRPCPFFECRRPLSGRGGRGSSSRNWHQLKDKAKPKAKSEKAKDKLEKSKADEEIIASEPLEA
eukprot:1879351-Pyramimonas_sp.AAC.1